MQEITSTSLTNLAGSRPRSIPGITNCTVIAHPSAGGVVIGQFTGVELEWLGLPRTSSVSQQLLQQPPVSDKGSSEEEDAFALRMMHLGARWWPSSEFEERHVDVQYPYGHHYPPELHVGYPSRSSSSSEGQGKVVLLLKTFPGNLVHRLAEDAPKKPNDWSRLAACKTTEERCAILRDFGATEWDDMEKCSDIPRSLEEGIAEGKKYEELLKKMKDVEYLDQ